jgi:hypothetical protein
MSDQNTRPELTLGDALRALPMQAPRGDVWASLAKGLTPPQRRARFVWPIAIAACALVAFAVFFARHQLPESSTATVATPIASSVPNETAETKMNATNATNDTNAQLAALQSRSRELEQWLHETAGIAAPLPGHDLAAAGEIESLIGVIDVELTAPQQRHEEQLWRRRVNLLEDLTALRYSNYRLAESGAAGNSAQPTAWIN